MITQLSHIPIFKMSIFFVGDCSGEEAQDKMYRLRGKKTKVNIDYSANGCCSTSGGDVFVWVRDLSMASVVAHELAHAACSIMDICGIKLCSETEEVMCYLIAWLKINVQDRVYEKLEKQEENT